jgi:hypothetical protein
MDLNHHTGSRSTELGAESILYVVKAPKADLENGEFYQDEKKLPQNFECTMDFSKFQQHAENKT